MWLCAAEGTDLAGPVMELQVWQTNLYLLALEHPDVRCGHSCVRGTAVSVDCQWNAPPVISKSVAVRDTAGCLVCYAAVMLLSQHPPLAPADSGSERTAGSLTRAAYCCLE